jgi:Spy/CpxP family protein refolding chaperone
MKTWIRRVLVGGVAVGVTLGGLTACGTRGGMSGDGEGRWSESRVLQMRGKVIERIGRELELDAAQRGKLEALADEMLAARKAIRGSTATPRVEMAALVAGERFDRQRADALLAEKTQTVQGTGPKVIAAMADFYDSLDPAQQAKVRDRMQSGRMMGRGWHRG